MSIHWLIRDGQHPLDALDEVLLDAMYGSDLAGVRGQARDIGRMRRALAELRAGQRDYLLGLVAAALSGAAVMTVLFTAIR